MSIVTNFILGSIFMAKLAGPVPQATMNLFPTTVGSTWVIRTVIPGQEKPVDLTITAVAPKAGSENEAVMRYTLGDNEFQEETFSVTPSSVARIRSGLNGTNVIDPPIPVIEYPMSVGKTWKWQGSISLGSSDRGQAAQASADLAVGALEDVKTEAGIFKAYRVDVNLTASAGGASTNVVNSYWFAAGVGMVKQSVSIDGGPTTVGTLVSYSIK